MEAADVKRESLKSCAVELLRSVDCLALALPEVVHAHHAQLVRDYVKAAESVAVLKPYAQEDVAVLKAAQEEARLRAEALSDQFQPPEHDLSITLDYIATDLLEEAEEADKDGKAYGANATNWIRYAAKILRVAVKRLRDEPAGTDLVVAETLAETIGVHDARLTLADQSVSINTQSVPKERIHLGDVAKVELVPAESEEALTIWLGTPELPERLLEMADIFMNYDVDALDDEVHMTNLCARTAEALIREAAAELRKVSVAVGSSHASEPHPAPTLSGEECRALADEANADTETKSELP